MSVGLQKPGLKSPGLPESTVNPTPRVYLAGPEVFLPDPLAVARAKKDLCGEYGLEGVFPLDSELDLARLPKREQAHAISQANEELLRGCDALVANLTPFRGPSADPGTVYELGLARGLGLPVFGYTNDPRPFEDRTREFLKVEGLLRADVPLFEAAREFLESKIGVGKPFGSTHRLAAFLDQRESQRTKLFRFLDGLTVPGADTLLYWLEKLGAEAGQDAYGMSLENFGLRDNLMLDGGIRLAGGVFAAHAADPEHLYTDLTGFAQCLMAARQTLPGSQGPQPQE